MAYDKIKSESYTNFGGINTKVSTYLTGANEVLDLVNFDFSKPGSWTQRQGSTLYFGTTFSPTFYGGISYMPSIRGLYEYEKLSGFSQLIVALPNGIYLGTGTSLTFSCSLVGGTYLLDFSVMNDSLYVFGDLYPRKYNGSTFYKFQLPYAAIDYGVTLSAGTSGTGYSGTILLKFGFLDQFGYLGPLSGQNYPDNPGYTIVLNGVSYSHFAFYTETAQLNTLGLNQYGLSGLALYVKPPNAANYYKIGTYGFSGTTSIFYSSGSSATSNAANQSIFSYDLARYPFVANNFQTGLEPLSGIRFVEQYNSQFYFAGMQNVSTWDFVSGQNTANWQSRVYWTETAEPEFIDPTYFAEIRTNDGDRITALKTYLNTLLIFKSRSFHRLIADSPTNISISEVSDQYGCLSNKCVIVYNQQCLFLDRKGVMRWDGANISCASNKIEPVFARINVPAAIDNAVGVHVKQKNQVWFSFPVDGATLNNYTIVYDYFADAWTTMSGIVPSVYGIAKGRLSEFNAFYGSYSGAIFNFGASLPSDNGTAITLSVSTMFYRDLGHSVEKQWRRLYMDVDVFNPGSTLTVNMFQDNDGSTIITTRYMPIGTFQNRIDFGIPAKSIQFQFLYSNVTLPIRINGITVESRYQRAV